MDIAHIDGASRELGEAQGYNPLPVRYGVFTEADGREYPIMSTAWTPNREEIEALIKGASIHVHVIGTQHPPINVEIGPVPGANDGN